MTEPPLLPGERVDDLMRGGLRIIQHPGLFCFGTDAVLLADFARVQRRERVCDLGSGVGILPLLIAARAPLASIDAVEIQAALCDMARRSVELNGLAGRVRVFEADLRCATETLGHGQYDCVVCNPPYFKADAGVHSLREEVRIARHETTCTLEDALEAGAKLLRRGGRLCMIHVAARAAEVIATASRHGLEAKAMRGVHFTRGAEAKLALFLLRKGGGPGLRWLPPLILRDERGQETAELRRIYGEEGE